MKELISVLTSKSDTRLERDELFGIVQNFSDNASVVDYINEFKVEDAYFHQLGFYKLIVKDLPGEFPRRVRLHYWKRVDVREDIHDHIASFSSRILYGSLVNETYSFGAAGARYFHSEFVPAGHGCSPAGQNASESFLELCEYKTLSAFEAYYFPYDRLHRAYPNSDELITLVVQDVPMERKINVYRSNIIDSETTEFARRLSPAETDAITARIGFLLKASHENERR